MSTSRKKARQVQTDANKHAHITLSDRDRDRFLAMLDADPTPNRALQVAVQRYRKCVRVSPE